MLPVNFRVQLKFGTQLRDQVRLGVKNKIDVEPGIERPGRVGKRPLVHLLDLLKLGAFFFKLRFHAVDNVVDTVFFSLRIEDQQRLITVLHAFSSSILLKVFIAETTPLSIAHFTASTARSMVDLTSGFSSSKKLLRT